PTTRDFPTRSGPALRRISPRRPRVRPEQPRHLLPERKEVLRMPARPPPGAREPALVDPSPLPAGESGRRQGHRLGDLASPGRDHFAEAAMALQDEVERRRLQRLTDPRQPIRKEG